ncbi:frequency clock protein [Stagonosporopsis vannaccii]|nr:frequency clock protein [Stagonosporopsis vannaccii]
MDERPGTVPAPAHGAHGHHPRRPPAHKSVSLRHSPPAKPQRAASTVAATARPARQSTTLSTSPNAPASDKANPPSSISPRLHLNNHSSGESSDAAGWFERTNNDASHDASFVDNDPPFLLHNSSSSERTPPDGHHAGMPSLPYRPNLMNLGTDGSSTEDFRSVIDDLTIANKKLKQRLRKYEKVYDAHLQEEKLFEVRFHGLPDHKKKELEETLRKFAAGLDDSTERPDISHVPTLNKEVTASSTSRFAESGYVSMSASGQNSSTPSNGASNQNIDNRKMTKSAYNRQQQSIQSYLHDIPLGLLPQDNAPMSDKARKKMVVRRLEQIFAGKRSAPGAHPQPMQQEEVAQSAATADRREREATGRTSRPEGQRTALIMPERTDTEGEDGGATLRIPAQHRVNEQDFAASGSGSPDQRPTRPLDLDPYRAQVPAANMDYFRHLGFSPPDMTTNTVSLEGHGWLYLNLLINMAQLHTLNVTPDNVKDAIAQYSTMLELSSDGRKVRWKGGHDFSKNSSDGSPEGRLGINSPYQALDAQRSPQKSSKTGHSSNESGYGGSEQRKAASANPEIEANKFAYKPLFFRRESSEEDVDYYDPTESASSLFQPQQRGDSSGFGSSKLPSNLSSKRRDDGPMIFYNKAKFCTDLTGDRVGASLTLPENYKTITSHPLGADLSTELGGGSEIWEPRGPLDDAKMDVDSKSGTRTPSTLESLGFSPAQLENNPGTETPDMMDFEVSGLGGVQPDDNFSIRVQRSQVPTGPTDSHTRRPSLYPSKIRALFSEGEALPDARRRSLSPKNGFQEKVISAVRRDMPSSELPPPSFFPFDSVSSGEVSDDEQSSDDGSDTGDGPSTALQLLNVAPPGTGIASDKSESDSSEASEYSEDSDDGSIDLLATARRQDPDTVRAFEREYDAAVADRFAEEIVAGSSAATAGGGSGFNSPASRAGGLSKEGSRNGTRNAQSTNSEASLSPRSKNLKRARTGESIATVMMNGTKASKTQRTE